MENEKIYLLYTDKKQTQLLALANNTDELKEETKYYSGGTWFEYDQLKGKFLVNEKIKKGVRFPKEPEKRDNKYFDDNKLKGWV